MRFHQIDPLQDPRWSRLVQRHPKASVFHTVSWLQALQQTYGYRPVVFTTSLLNEELENGLLFCHVRSWLTGGRMVSLPFSDHCEPLFDSSQELQFVMQYLKADLQHRNWRYIELRPANGSLSSHAPRLGFQADKRYCLHCMDLRPSLDDIFRSLHKNSAQRRIRHAKKIGVICECGISSKLLKDFYDLLVMTRGRHHLPPQPIVWFRNLIASMNDRLEIRVAYQENVPIAAILTLRFRETVYYKYGCSSVRFKHLGAMPYLLWNAIEDSKKAGALEFDLGRSDRDNPALISFKNHWARNPLDLTYWAYPEARLMSGWKMSTAKRVFAWMPDRLLAATGRVIYRHIA